MCLQPGDQLLLNVVVIVKHQNRPEHPKIGRGDRWGLLGVKEFGLVCRLWLGNDTQIPQSRIDLAQAPFLSDPLHHLALDA